MSGSLNKACILGNCVRDPEVRHTKDGKPIVNLTVATSETWKDRNTGERKEKAEFHKVCIFSEGLAKVAEAYIKKGSSVYIEGQLQTRKWTDKDGVDKYSTEIVLQGFNSVLTLLGGKQEAARPDPEQEFKTAVKQSFARDLDDEVPF
jgi:single-strand DNA-binding protein